MAVHRDKPIPSETLGRTMEELFGIGVMALLMTDLNANGVTLDRGTSYSLSQIEKVLEGVVGEGSRLFIERLEKKLQTNEDQSDRKK